MKAGDGPALDDPSFYSGDPDSALAGLRADHPVWWYEPGKFWALTRHADVLAVSRDPRRFCNSQGVLMNDRERPIAAADSLLYLDPPQHAHYRNLVNRAFTPRRMANLEPWIRGLTRDLIAKADLSEPVDFVDTIGAPLPILVIAELLGVPGDDRHQFRLWSDAVAAAAMGDFETTVVPVLDLIVYFQEALGDRATHPRDDLLSALVNAEVDGTRLTEQELIGFCMTLLVAGNETSRSALSGGVLALAEHPEQRAALAADPAKLGLAAEEILRWVTPITTFSRTATEDVEMGQATIAEGDFVVLVYRSANRDELVFGDDAARFRVERDPNPQLAFGFGEHYCMGAALARLELRAVLEEVLTAWPSFELAGEVTRVPSTLFNQYEHVPIRVK
jgi:cytochrome P450